MYVEIVTSIFTGLAICIVALRLYTRFFLVKGAGLDDLIISCALVSDLASYAFMIAERVNGLGVPTSRLSTTQIERQLFWLWLSVPFYNLTMILAKISALTLFTRVFHPRSFLLVTYILIGFLVVVGLWTTLSGFIYCIPIHYFWNPSADARRGHCLPDGPVWFTNAGIQTFTDLVIVALPLPLLWKLQLPKKQKCGVLVVFSLGIFIVATSGGRLYELNIMVNGGNFTEANAQAAMWSSLEANISIICICLPPLHPLLSRAFSFFFLPQPVRSSATKRHSTKTTFKEPLRRDDGIWSNNLFNPAAAGYSATISKVDTNEDGYDEDGIRVVRELRLQSDSIPVPSASGPHPDLEMCHGARGSISHGNTRSTLDTERDFDDFEFPDYDDKMSTLV
ncbi:hypothetical protein N7491_010524 [Penicillium cf. griseofulvum]|nr:hypothetical protein N7491_010524 [Penicillium cf. griseofulvum]